MKSRTIRSITGFFIAVLFVAVVLGALKLHKFFFDILVLIFMAFGAYEVSKAVGKKLGKPILPIVFSPIVLGYALFFVMSYLDFHDFFPSNASLFCASVFLLFIAVAMLATAAYHLISQRKTRRKTASDETGQNDTTKNTNVIQEPKNTQYSAVGTFFCLIYPLVLMTFMLSLNYLESPYRGMALVLLFTVSPFTDVLAYAVGSTLKGKKLCPKISPKKTISGAIGGLVGGLLGGAFLILLTTNSAFEWVEIGGIIGNSNVTNAINCLLLGLGGSICTQGGDILASYIKRKCELKDFGNLLPGHGGIMDRIDGMILGAAFIFVYMTILSLVF